MLQIERNLDVSELDRAQTYMSEHPDDLMFLQIDRTDFDGRGPEFSVTIGAEAEDGSCSELFFPTHIFPELRQAYDLLHVVRVEGLIRELPIVDLVCINDHVINDVSTMGFGICGNCMSFERVEEEMEKAIEHETEESRKPKLELVS